MHFLVARGAMRRSKTSEGRSIGVWRRAGRWLPEPTPLQRVKDFRIETPRSDEVEVKKAAKL